MLSPKRKRRSPSIEMLETRKLLSTSIWTGAAGDHLYTTGANWQSGTAPAPGDDIIFGALSTAQTVDVNVASTVGNVSISGTYTISDQTLTLNGDVEANASAVARFTDTIAVTTNSHFTSDTGAVLTVGTLGDTSSNTLDKFGTGVLQLAGDSHANWQLLAGTLTVQATTHINVSEFAGDLNGAGVVTSISDTGGTVSPGSATPVATLTATSNTFLSGGTLAIELDDPLDSSSLTASAGTVQLLNSPTLAVTLGTSFPTAAGATYDVLHNNTGVAISGTFANLAQGATYSSGGETFTISYTGGTTGRDVVLTTVGAAPTVVLTASATKVVINQQVELDATVMGFGGLPSGTVTFLDNGRSLGTATLDDGSSDNFLDTRAVLFVNSIPAGTNVITAVYSGDTSFIAATSAPVTIFSTAIGPLITRPAAARLLTAKSVTLSVVANDTSPQQVNSLRYTWTVIKSPAGARAPIFSDNGTKSARTTVASFTKDGTYHFRVTVTNQSGRVRSSDVDYLVKQYARAIRVTPHQATVGKEMTIQFKTIGLDQFAHPLRKPGVASYSVSAGTGFINASTGVYTAGRQAGPVTIEAVLDDIVGLINVTIV